MAWSRFEPGFARHPKRLRLGPVASWLWACSVDHCTEYRTDGFVDEAAVASLCPAIRGAALKRAIAALVDVGSWERTEGGYRVHGYLEHNPTADQVEADRAASRQRYDRWKKRRTNAVTNALATEQPNDVATGLSVGRSVGRSVSQSTTPAAAEPGAPTSNGFKIAPSILAALDRSARLGAVPRLRAPEFWQAQVRANGDVDLPAEILKAEAWLQSNPTRAPRKDLTRFLGNWLTRCHRGDA